MAKGQERRKTFCQAFANVAARALRQLRSEAFSQWWTNWRETPARAETSEGEAMPRLSNLSEASRVFSVLL
jgi:hypothetical protein